MRGEWRFDSKLIDWVTEKFHPKKKGQIDKDLIDGIYKLSRGYLGITDIQDPWASSICTRAYLYYFFPRNELRSRAVFSELKSMDFFKDVSSITEFGSGPGSSWWALGQVLKTKKNIQYDCIERSLKARQIHQSLEKFQASPFLTKWSDQITNTKSTHPKNPAGEIRTDSKTTAEESVSNHSNNLLIASYSFNELDQLPQWIDRFEKIILIEPSTQSHGRQLLKWRKLFIEMGYHCWAPCTHQGACPLLEQSAKDWCHDRLEAKNHPYMLQLDESLKMKTHSLSFGYIALSREEKKWDSPEIGRIIGDVQIEKGKSKQMICRSSKREFVSWLKRQKIQPQLIRGDLVTLPPESEVRANEVRISELPAFHSPKPGKG